MGSTSMLDLAMFPEIEAAAAATVSRDEVVGIGATIHSTMEPAMYYSAKKGDVGFLASRTQPYSSFLTPDKNTILHIAIRFEQLEFASHVLSHERLLLFQTNSKGDTPLHVAARLRRLAAAKLLIEHFNKNSTDLESGPGVLPVSSRWRAANSEGNTPLHEALICRNDRTAILLLRQDPGLANCVNNGNESPLYLAASFGFLRVVEVILRIGRTTAQEISLAGPNGQTPLHAVAMMVSGKVKRRKENAAIGGLLCEEMPNSVVRKIDNFGRTALHYSSAAPALRISELLLQGDRTLAYVSDNNGHTPLVIAALLGHWRTRDIILKYCPDCGEICNFNGQNIFHLVTQDRRLTIRTSKHPELRHLLNEKDNLGDTSLHIAAKVYYDYGIRKILSNTGINVIATNKEGLTALDIAESRRSSTRSSRIGKRRLVRHGAARRLTLAGEKTRITPSKPVEEIKQLANTLIVVATLTATITFATIFQLPGGYSTDQPGSALFAKKAAFVTFMLSDAFVLCSSMICIFFLVWGLLSEGESAIRTAVGNVANLLSYTYLMTMVAFTSAAYLVIEKESKWLAITIMVMGYSVLIINKLQWNLFPRLYRYRVSNKF